MRLEGGGRLQDEPVEGGLQLGFANLEGGDSQWLLASTLCAVVAASSDAAAIALVIESGDLASYSVVRG